MRRNACIRICMMQDVAMAFSDKGDLGRMLFILKEHRKELLDTIHANQNALDSLAYLIVQTEKKEGNKR